jgi:hypothetical protein
MKFLLCVLVFCFASVKAHSTFYPHVRELLAFNNGTRPEAPAILSWHIHICYILSKDETRSALELRNRTREHFKEMLGPDCPGRFDTGHLCMIIDVLSNFLFKF